MLPLPPEAGLPPEVWLLVSEQLPFGHPVSLVSSVCLGHNARQWHRLSPKRQWAFVKTVIRHQDLSTLHWTFDSLCYSLPNEGLWFFHPHSLYGPVTALVEEGQLDILSFLISRGLSHHDFRHLRLSYIVAAQRGHLPTVHFLLQQLDPAIRHEKIKRINKQLKLRKSPHFLFPSTD